MGARLTEGGDWFDKYTSIQSTFTGEFSFLEDMVRINADYTLRRGNNNYEWYYTKYKIGYGPGDVRELGQNEAYRSTTFDYYDVFNIYGTFNKLFGRHNVTTIVGYNQEENRSEWFSAEKNKVISASLPTIALATGDAYVDEWIAEWAIRGAFARVNYTFSDKYIVEFNGRYDGSSKFPKEDRFGFFPSFSAAWRVDREGFMAPLENIVSMFKLRGSYGSLGNQFVTEYGYIPSMNAYLGSYIIGDARPQAVSAPPLVSSNYTWEQVTSINFGLDAGFMNNKLTASFDYYIRDTEGMLTQGKDLPDVLGASEPRENAADLETKGWELSLDYKTRFTVGNKPLSVNARFILSDNKTTITNFDNPNKNLIQFYEGMEMGEIWGLQSDGLFETQAEIDALDETDIIPWGALSIVPGWPKYVDQDGNGLIEKGLTVDEPKDLKVIGNFTPRYRFGFNLSLAWNGIDFRVFFQGVGKRDYYPVDYLYWGFYQQPYTGGFKHLNDFYRAEDETGADRDRHSQSYIDAGLADQNLDAKYPILQAWLADRNLGERIDESEGLAIPQTGYLLDGSYIRLKNLTIGYTLPASLTERARVGRVRIYVSGENIATWSELKEFYDPEAITQTSVKLDPSVSAGRQVGSGYAYPFMKSYSFGINVTF
jgi:TonB-linked SusC/RagA family outer membrane protein